MAPGSEVAGLESALEPLIPLQNSVPNQVSCDLVGRRPINLDPKGCGKCSWLPSPPSTQKKAQWRRAGPESHSEKLDHGSLSPGPHPSVDWLAKQSSVKVVM